MNKDKIVALVEPSYYGVSFAKAAFTKGFTVVAIVSSKDNPVKYSYKEYYHDLIVADIRDIKSVSEAIRNSKFKGKLTALIPATDYASHITAKVAEELGLRGVSYEAALRARNKDLARQAYKNAGVPGAQFKIVKNFNEAVNAAEEIGYPVVVKPTNCASSQNVFYVNNQDNLEIVMKEMAAFRETYMGFKVREEYLIEEYIEGQEFSVEVFLYENEVKFAAVTEKITTPLPYFAELGHILPTSVYLDKKESIINTAVSAMKAIGITNGPSHVEVKLSKSGPRIIEVNGRPGGDNISSDLLINALGVNIFEAAIDYYVGNPVKIEAALNKASAIAYISAEREGIISKIEGVENLDNNKYIVKYNITVKAGDFVQPPRNSDDRLGYIISVADTPAEAKNSVMAAAKSITLNYK